MDPQSSHRGDRCCGQDVPINSPTPLTIGFRQACAGAGQICDVEHKTDGAVLNAFMQTHLHHYQRIYRILVAAATRSAHCNCCTFVIMSTCATNMMLLPQL